MGPVSTPHDSRHWRDSNLRSSTSELPVLPVCMDANEIFFNTKKIIVYRIKNPYDKHRDGWKQ